MSIVLDPGGCQLDLFSTFSDPAPAKIPQVETETRVCGTCGGKGSYKVELNEFDRDGRFTRKVWANKTCPDCHGEKKRVVSVKADCPPAAKSAGTETGSILAATAFTRAMVAAGYARKVTHGGDVNLRKAKQCCNALLHGVASDRPEPSVTCWKLATETLGMDSGFWDFHQVTDDPDPGACARRVAAVEAARGTKK